MSKSIIQERLASYDCKSDVEERQALREITQEVALAALGRGDFFKHAVFQGGTCLRIFYGLNRFSEDMDFILKSPDPDFQLKNHIENISDELKSYGYDIEIDDRGKADSTVKKAFLKDNSIGKVLKFRHSTWSRAASAIKIKIEVDTNPPAFGGTELKYLDFPFVSSVAVQDKPSLFAGKIHALLCRSYIKGRDWYDFIWYTSNKIGVNYKFLSSALNQVGSWKGLNVEADKAWTMSELGKRISSLDWKQAAEDVRRFVKPAEQASLDLWGKDLFLSQLQKLS